MNIIYHFTTSHGGFSKEPYKSLNLSDYVGDDEDLVLKNIEQVKSNIGIEKMCFMKQIHGDTVKIVNDDTKKYTCDAIITNQKNLALCVLVADCIPVLLYDEKNHIIAAIHVGRAGVFKEIVKKTIFKMNQCFNSNPQNITAFIGNCIHQCCYEIKGDILKDTEIKYPSFVKNSHLDIHGILNEQLKNLGVNIVDEGKCTSCNHEFFSYRRDKITGRNAGIIMLRK